MAAKWIKTNFPGVRYREHPTRKNGVKRHQYFTIRYKLAGKDREEGLGWASENWTAAKAYDRLKELKENRKSGEGPQTLAEKREIEDRRKEAEKQTQELAEKEVKPDDLIFPKRTTTTAGAMAQTSKSFARVVEELGLNRGVTDRKQKVTFHTLRHSFATHLYEGTHDLYLTQRSLGHATGTMTARYAKMSESRLREGAAALEKVFLTKGKPEQATDKW